MSQKIVSRVWDADSRASGMGLLVLLALAQRADDAGECKLSMKEISGMTGTEMPSASRIVSRLEREGFIQVQRGGGRGQKSSYRVLGASQ